jgi:hypothetical protein
MKNSELRWIVCESQPPEIPNTRKIILCRHTGAGQYPVVLNKRHFCLAGFRPAPE